VAAIIFALTVIAPASAIVSQSEEFYVADYAGVLTDSTKQDIIDTNDALEHNTGGQIVVVTVEYLDGLFADEYAVSLMNDWGVGDADKNNGMLLLLATEESKAWLTQGAGIDTAFDSDKIDSLLDNYFWDDFDNREFDSAVSALFAQLVDWYEDYYNFDIKAVAKPEATKTPDAAAPDNPANNPSTQAASHPRASFSETLMGFFLFILLVWFIFKSVKRRRINRKYREQYPPAPPPVAENMDQNVTYNIHNYSSRRGFGWRKREEPPRSSGGFFGGPDKDKPKERSKGGFFGGGHSSGGGAGRGGSSSSGGRSGGGGHSSGGGGGRR